MIKRALVLTSAFLVLLIMTGAAFADGPFDNWTEKTTVLDNTLFSSAFGNNTFIFGGQSQFRKSGDNGSTWSTVTATDNYNGIWFSDGRFLAAATFGAISSSADNGSTWQTLRNAGENEVFYGVASGNGRIVAVGHRATGTYPTIIVTSADNGSTWTRKEFTGVTTLEDVIYAGGRFVAVGRISIDQNTGVAVSVVSADGDNWTVTDTALSNRFSHVAYGNGMYVAAGMGVLAYSCNGINWISINGLVAANEVLSGAAFGNGRFVVVGGTYPPAAPIMLNSTDGVSWTRNTFTANYLRTVSFGNDYFVLSGDDVNNTSKIFATSSAVPAAAGPSQCGTTATAVLSVSKAGTGTGSVSVNLGAIAWSVNAGTATYNSGASIILSAAADGNSSFTGWSGDCTGADGSTSVTLNADKACTATFALTNPFYNPNMSVSPSGKDFGNVGIGKSSSAQVFTISNTGTSDLFISSMGVTGGDSSMFKVALGSCAGLSTAIGVGVSCTVTVKFTPSSTGAKATTLRISTSYPDIFDFDAALTGTGGGQACKYTVSPATKTAGASKTTGSFSVATKSSCPWTASSDSEWLAITSGASANKSGKVNYSVAANTGMTSRMGIITAAGKTFTLKQAGRPDLSGTLSNVAATKPKNSKYYKFTGSLTVSNAGEAKAKGVTAKVYLSSDTAYDSADKLLGTLTIGAVNAGGTTTKSLSSLKTAEVPAGKYIIVVIDPADKIKEADETNNTVVSGVISQP